LQIEKENLFDMAFSVMAWNYGFPAVSPFADVLAAVALSMVSINLKHVIK